MGKLTEEQKAELQALAEMSDDDIDLSDIPEMTDEEWARARRGMFYQPKWKEYTFLLDENIIDWFEENALNPAELHKDINNALMEHIRRERFPNWGKSREPTGGLMPLNKILQSLKGQCRYCGQNAGFPARAALPVP